MSQPTADDPEPTAMTIAEAHRVYYFRLVGAVKRRADEYGLSDGQVDVEGVVQEAFEAALPQWHNVRNPHAWLLTVARHRLQHHIAEAVRRADNDLSAVGESHMRGRWSSLAPTTSAECHVATRQVIRAMRDLPDKRQTATYLRFVEEWTPREIAELLHCTPATARVHAHQGAKEISNVVAHPNEYAPLEYSPRGTRNVRYYRTAPGARAALLISVLAGAAMGMIWTWFVVWLLADHWASVWLWGLGTAAVAVLAWLGRRFLWPAVRRLQARCR